MSHPDVVVAVYHYRHEAEFAAGFLASANIPYRLEADDAGGIDAGVTLVRPAKLWVRHEHAREAQELLDVTPDAVLELPKEGESPREGQPDPPARGLFIRSDPQAGDREQGRGGVEAGLPGAVASRDPDRLCGAERAVALTLGGALTGLALGFQDVLAGGPGGDAWVIVVVAIGVTLLISGLVGRTWAPIRSFLRALSGVAP